MPSLQNCQANYRTNTPTFWTAPSTITYTEFEAAFHVYDPTSFLQWAVYSQSCSPPSEEEFVAKEEMNKSTYLSASEGATTDDDTMVTSNVDLQSANPDAPCPIHPMANHK